MNKSSASLMSGVPELLVLQLLASREMYGYELARAIRTLTADAVALGESVLYPALHLLEQRGLVRGKRRTVEGRTRVYYTITGKGRRRLEHLTTHWRRIAGGVESVLAERVMRDARFAAVEETLLRAGVAPRHARRAVFEMTGHFDDLVAELCEGGMARAAAEAEALGRLNPTAMVAAASARSELHSWVRRWPLASCTVFPLGMYMAFVVGSIALLIGGVSVMDSNLGVALSSSRELQRFATFFLACVVWGIPVLAAGTFCSIALARRTPMPWSVIGVVLVSLAGATLNADLLLPPNDRPGFQAGFGFGTDALAQPLLRAALTLAIVLPLHFLARHRAIRATSRAATHKKRGFCSSLAAHAARIDASRFVALLAIVALHVAVFVLLMSPRPYQVARIADDPAMTLIVIPPATPRVVVPERAAPALSRARERAPPRTESPRTNDVVPDRGPPTLIDWAREAQLAVGHQVDVIELERRRARGFTPDAQNREPEVAHTPAPEFAWSLASTQRVQALPEGGTLIRLNDRCAIVIYVIPFPVCGVGEIPANGGLFEHMNDAPVAGDWKDDSAVTR